MCRKVDSGTANFRRMYLFGGESSESSLIHEEPGTYFMVVKPGGSWRYVGDSDAINNVLRRPEDFRRTEDFRRNMEQVASSGNQNALLLQRTLALKTKLWRQTLL
ncbi:hypothetical protein BKA66DRAFT_472082 [Pyrenochaeta sp. MPI-SDFR-AT-0127]|nr:hypothetical protein BKA66DRAFT_472082 [Pyrenochaeta sp. MPI-SDFR-AT-0127]